MSGAAPKPLRLALTVTVLLLLGVVLAVLSFAYPSTEATRLRNALLLDTRPAGDPAWTPDHAPASFRRERHPMPESIRAGAAVAIAGAGSADLDVARALAGHLLSHATRGGRIDAFDVAETYRTILDEGTGYCADVIDSFIALSHAAGLAVRPWAFSFDGLGGHGHIVVEVFDRQRGRWVMMDVFNNVLALDRRSGEPLDAMTFRSMFIADHDSIRFVPIGPWRQEFAVYTKLVGYYADGIDEWYLWNGNNVVERADHWLVRAAGRVTEELAEAASIAVGRSPHIVPVPSARNEINVARLKSIRFWLLAALDAAIVLSCLALSLAVALAWRRHLRPVAG